ncbi:uncharacterized protein LOC142337055 [Convolutriloba macropyga]|uniref:uncharacterized protein LOC142337055 n=1 Tax=Convolutriloba macropyga TaxID=536237 RepID=UPI003F526E4D
MAAQESKKMISFSFTIPKKDLLAHVQQTPGAPAPESPEYLIVDQNGQNCTGTFKLGGSGSQAAGGVKLEPVTSWGASDQTATQGPGVKAEPMDHNDSGYAEGAMPGAPAIKSEPHFDMTAATSTPVKTASDGVVFDQISGKHKCATCAKLFASKAGATKHVQSQHRS